MESNEQHILQKHLARFLIDEVFNLPDESALLSIKSPHKWVYQGRELTEAEIDTLRGQAERFLNSELWKIIRDGLKQDAIDRGVNKSKTEGDIIASKVELYVLTTIENTLKHMTQQG